jgi:hypothetical protein
LATSEGAASKTHPRREVYMKHILHYNTHAEKRYFLGNDRKCYDIIGLNGNIVSHSPDGVAAFLATVNKPFYMDPQTHAFQHSTIHLKRTKKELDGDTGMEFKPSIVRLAVERLKEPFSRVISTDRPLTPLDFSDSANNPIPEIIFRVCESVVHFQTGFLSESIDDETKEFMENSDSLLPDFVVAPYFYLSELSWREWLAINISCYRTTKSISPDRPVFLEIVLSKGMLGQVTSICRMLSDSLKAVDGVLLWIDEHEEEELSEAECVAYIKMLRLLRSITKNVLSIHGGYLSTLLCHSDAGHLLSGTGHSANYGEYREVVPIGGGIPRARFYLFKAHSRLRFAEAAEIVTQKGWLKEEALYRANVCSCSQCVQLISDLGSPEAAFGSYGNSHVTVVQRRGTVMRFEYPTTEAKDAGIRHYIYNKSKENEDLLSRPLRVLVDDLGKDYSSIAIVSGGEYVSHLQIWRRALESTKIV